MKPLTPADAGFLWLEKRNQPMHVGGLQLLTPPADAPEDFSQRIAAHFLAADTAVKPFNQRLVKRFGMWFWDEDRHFDIEYHFTHLSLPKPGRIRELLALVSKLHGNLMDRERPLWEFYLIDGLEDGRIAVYAKIHHALVDGVASMRMLQKSMTEDPDERGRTPLWAMPREQRDRGEREPKSFLAQVMEQAVKQARTLPTVAREVARSIRARSDDPDYVSVFQAPESILNQKVDGSRRFAAQSWDLARIRAAGKRHGGTLNDTVLAMCGSALRQYLLDQNALPEDPLVAMVPVSMRQDDSDSGNQVAMILANLGTHIADPVERLKVIRGSVQHMKERFQNLSQAEIMNYLGATMALSGIHMVTGALPQLQPFNVVISNVPGPRNTLYFEGAKLDGVYPVSIVMDGAALNITLNSYAEKLEFGLIACRRTLPSMQNLLKYLEDGLTELEQG